MIVSLLQTVVLLAFISNVEITANHADSHQQMNTSQLQNALVDVSDTQKASRISSRVARDVTGLDTLYSKSSHGKTSPSEEENSVHQVDGNVNLQMYPQSKDISADTLTENLLSSNFSGDSINVAEGLLSIFRDLESDDDIGIMLTGHVNESTKTNITVPKGLATTPASQQSYPGPKVPDIPTAVSRMGRVICYFNASSAERRGKARFPVSSVNVSLCSDLYYDHAVIHNETYELKSASLMDILPLDGNFFLPRFTEINDFKLINRHLRTFLTVSESNWTTFVDVLREYTTTEMFVVSCSKNLRLWGFDGLNLQWLYPPTPPLLTAILRRLKLEFEESYRRTKMYLYLAVTLAGDLDNPEDFYEVNAISNLVDYINVLAYRQVQDISAGPAQLRSPLYANQTGDPVPGHSLYDGNQSSPAQNISGMIPSELDGFFFSSSNITDSDVFRNLNSNTSQSRAKRSVPSAGNDFSVEYALEKILRQGADLSKLNIALTLIGHGFTLSGLAAPGREAHVSGPSPKGTGGVPGYDTYSWITYEDMESIAQKVDFLKEKNVKGIMIIAQSEDDFSGAECGLGPFPVSTMVLTRSSFDTSYWTPKAHAWQRICNAGHCLSFSAHTSLILGLCIEMLLHLEGNLG